MKGWRTIAFGLFVAVGPAAVTYLGGIDWTSLGINPTISAAIGVVIVGLRAITNSAIGQK